MDCPDLDVALSVVLPLMGLGIVGMLVYFCWEFKQTFAVLSRSKKGQRKGFAVGFSSGFRRLERLADMAS
jgi:hypothetical protein